MPLRMFAAGLITGTILATTMTSLWCFRVAENRSKLKQMINVGGYSYALHKLENGEIDAAEDGLQGDLLRELGDYVGTSRMLDYYDYWNLYPGANDRHNRKLDIVSAYCDRVHLFEKRYFTTNSPLGQPVFQFLESRRKR